jgi:hypothetical protein
MNFETYPDRPGFKGDSETGREAAAAIAPKLGRLQRLVRELVAARGTQGITPEEAADVTGQDRVSLQPRFSELKAKGTIVDSGNPCFASRSRSHFVCLSLSGSPSRSNRICPRNEPERRFRSGVG